MGDGNGFEALGGGGERASDGEKVESELGEEGEVEEPAAGQRGGDEHDGEQDRDGEAGELVREEAKEERVSGGGKEPGGEFEELVVPGKGADLAAELLARLGEDAVRGDGPRLKKDAVAGAGDLHGDEDVVENEAGRERGEELAADSVDGAGDADNGAGGGLQAADEFLDAPVQAEGIAGGGTFDVEEKEFTRDGADGGIGEVSGEGSHGVRGNDLAEVEKEEEVAGSAGKGGVKGEGLAAGGREKDGDEAGVGLGVSGEDGVGAVGGAVGDDDDLEQVGGVGEGIQVRELARKVLGLVAGRHDDGDRRREGREDGRARAQAVQDGKQHGVAGVGIDDQGQGDPEERLQFGSTKDIEGGVATVSIAPSS